VGAFGKKMGQNLRIGLTAVDDYLIKSEHAAKHVGSGEVEALFTPAIIAFMEKTTRKMHAC
jgi:predicted thioesterase